MSVVKNFLDLPDLSSGELKGIIAHSIAMKNAPRETAKAAPLAGKTLAMVFDKPSTRTRVSFDVAMRQLGGGTVVLDQGSTQLGRGESIADTARVLSRYVDAIMIRTTAHDRILEMAEYADIPVINGLTDDTHPCQIMADVMTFEEHRGSIAGKKIAWVGDGNNMLQTFLQAAAQFDFIVHAAVPEGKEPEARFVEWSKNNGGRLKITNSAEEAVHDADCVVTDTWVSMGDDQMGRGENTFLPFQVNQELMAKAKPDALFMHDLPAYRGKEVTAEVIDGPQSVVFDEAENRLHAQKGILAWCLGVDSNNSGS
jgi:ornithine carbamoyltransferase